jgi:hypothetical protein
LRTQALTGIGAGGAWLLLVRYGVVQGLNRWECAAAHTSSGAFAAIVRPDRAGALGALSTASYTPPVPAELIHAMASMVLSLAPKEESLHAR